MYRPPLPEIRFALELAGLDRLRAAGFEDVLAPELVGDLLQGAGALAEEVLAPLQRVGDREGCRLENGVVFTPTGWREAYRRFVEGGWNTLPFPAEIGGQGLPWTLALAIEELWHGANTAFALCPLLNQGAVELMARHAGPGIASAYLPKLVSGAWTGTMNLTESQAGSDVGAIRTRAWPEGSAWRIKGQKIFITYGEHDLSDNILHLVLARTPDAPAGVKGISLFLVPKFLAGPDGQLGTRNDLRCVSIEEKLGIHGSPTCLMAYGEDSGALGFLIGAQHRGLEAMFTMMNNARLGVGVQGLGIAERACQQALAFARTRLQGRALNGSAEDGPVPIIRHPDVRRMLLGMRARTEAMRALAFSAGVALDLARKHPDASERARQQAFVDLLTPVVKAWSTDLAVEIASTGIQVHGGMGFIEETGAAQLYRDVRVAPIYEGTNGIQAQDLVLRKLGRDRGIAARAYIGELRRVAAELDGAPGLPAGIAKAITASLANLDGATHWIVAALRRDPREAAAVAAPYLRLLGTVAGGVLLGRGAVLAARHVANDAHDRPFLEARIASARFYAAALLPEAASLSAAITAGTAAAVLEGPEDLAS